MNWRDKALCKGTDTRLFFPEKGNPSKTIQLMRDLCDNCEVQPQCLEEALSQDEQYGYQAGYSATQRMHIKSRRNFPVVVSTSLTPGIVAKQL